jgi:transcription-repair coupling factor (superfamily II helicase)
MAFKNLSPLKVITPIKAGQKKHFKNLVGANLSISLTEVIQSIPQQHLLITDTAQSATKLQQELQYLLPKRADSIYHFPDLEILPYDNFSASEDILSERMRTLYDIQSNRQAIVIVAINTLLKRLPPAHFITAQTFVVRVGQKIKLEHERLKLENSGYQFVNQVLQRGEFSIRGSILDIFPMGANTPYRIDLFDDEIDTIRAFDLDTQRSQETITKVEILPTHEYLPEYQNINIFAKNWQAHFNDRGLKSSPYEITMQGGYAPGMEFYLPLFYEETTNLTDYLAQDSVITHVYETADHAQHFWLDINTRYDQLSHDIQNPILNPEALYFSAESLFSILKSHPQIHFHRGNEKAKATALPFKKLPELYVNYQFKQPYKHLLKFCETIDDYKISKTIFSADSIGRRKLLLEHLLKLNIRPTICESWQEAMISPADTVLISSPLTGGFIWETHLAFITEADLFRNHISAISKQKKTHAQAFATSIFQDLSVLKVGTAVVHIEHGVGRYQGLTTLEMGNQTNEYLTLTYGNEEKLYVPIHALHLVSRYSGTDIDNAPLNRLGTDKWDKIKEKAAKKIQDVAAELLEIYANRVIKSGFSNIFDKNDYLAFCQGFPFEETEDQQTAIREVLDGMISPQPMDRLVCGDVGFGKTEVAMRATYLATHNNKQVAILVPTTLLAQQHYENFRDRFANLPVNVDVLSRFKTAKQQKEAMLKLSQGNTDIIIGTHKLLSKEIKFHNLGLLIIDEEHRFGVKHKEQMKALRADIDILTMTATPIPRTLNMALSDIRDLSIIATPPAKRLAVKTFVREFKNDIVKEAILRETMRGGQVYFLHNKVETIFATQEKLQSLFPDLNIAIAHGQMREKELEQIMFDFQQNKYHVLVCTTIIETGIDIPNANTIIMERADNFGLAQLHQLRGRVGRSHHQAYAYLLTPPFSALSKDAVKRLDALKETDSLGAGFMLANHDLEIRGAGELLGKEQSGNIEGIGFSLYMELLQKTVAALQQGRDIKNINFNEVINNTEIELRIPALIPEPYLFDVHTRLTFYKRISSAETHQQLDDIKIELVDRFGLLMPQIENLFATAHIRINAIPLGIKKIEMHTGGGSIQFLEKPDINPITIIKMVQMYPDCFQLSKSERIIIKKGFLKANERIEFIQGTLKKLSLG